MTNFYSRFIRGYAVTVAPLYDILQDKVAFVWGNAQQAAFDKLKTKLGCTEVLAPFDPDVIPVLSTDASDRGIGAV